jgi:alpha-beta hydrolase superfamily lysophospholipase
MPLKRWQRWTVGLAGGMLMAVTTAFVLESRSQAHILVTNPAATRKVPTRTPAAFHLPYDDVEVTTSDGLTLPGWWIPPAGRGVIVLVHGYKGHRGQLLGVAEVFHRHGYGLLIPALRAHDRSGGEVISFGYEETKDLDAWQAYLHGRGDVDPARIGMLGVSMGGEIAIKYASEHANIRALVADCAFSSVDETVATSVHYFTGLPAFPFAPMIRFWVDRELGFDSSRLDAKQWIPNISPRPVLVMQGGADVVISVESGKRLFAAAGEPKELWFEPAVAHAKFFDTMPQEYERRVVGFFDRYFAAPPETPRHPARAIK